MNDRRQNQFVRGSCLLALLALGLMVWSLFDPRPIPVVVAMSVGQVLGTLSLGCFLCVVIADVRARLIVTKTPEKQALSPTDP